MERIEIAPSDIDSERETLVKHALGWTRGRSLCGAEMELREPRPGFPDCVVCCSLWDGMGKAQHEALWGLYR